jgi:hypothetical protein
MMAKFFIWVMSRISMKRIHFLFMDKVNHKAVHLYRDCFFNEYLAQSKYGHRILRKQLRNRDDYYRLKK